LLSLSAISVAQSSELAITAGAAFTPDTKGTPFCEVLTPCPSSGNISIDPGFTIGGAFAHRLANFHAASIALELPLFAAPSRRKPAFLVNVNFSSLFFTPSLKLNLLPGSSVSPFLSGGAGLGYFSGNTGNVTWATQIGCGLDFKTPLPHLGIRAEVRDFISGVPSIPELNAITAGHLQAIVAGGGVIFKF
jgi:hypothetical protein